MFLAACPITPEPAEPSQPVPPDAPAASSDALVPTTNVFASSFDQYCTRDDECVAVYEGNMCASCRCANAAIRRDAMPEFRAESGAFWSCHDPDACGADCTAVTGSPAICVANKCTLPGIE